MSTLRSAVCAAVLCAAAGSVQAATIPVLQNGFNMIGLTGDDTLLRSYGQCDSFIGFPYCYLAYEFSTSAVDALVQLKWKDRHGNVLVSGTSQPVGSFFNPQNFYEYTGWSEQRRGLQYTAGNLSILTSKRTGKADFTGSIGTNKPCGSVLICDADYYEWNPSLFGTGSGGGGGGGNEPRAAAAAPAQPATTDIVGTLSVIDSDPSAPDDPLQATYTGVVELKSSVAVDGDGYLYTYSATNLVDVPIELVWTEAGLVGTLDALGTLSTQFHSALAPTGIATQPELNFGSLQIATGLTLLTPVPESSSLLFAAAGFGLLAWRLARRLS